MVMPLTLRSMLNAPTRGHDFGPDDSTILSSLYHPVTAGRKLADFLRNNIETAAGLNSGYDNPNPLLGPSDESRVNAAMTLAGLMQTGSMPFGPVSKGGTLGSIPVWHGSPHKFDEFSLKNIGTGEGAQAYGHGLYFAESPEVAEQYSKVLNMPKIDAINKELSRLAKVMDEDSLGGYRQFKSDIGRDAANKYDALMAEKMRKTPNLYKASLEWPDAAREAADPLGPQHFLDWDKPISENPQSIRDLLAKFNSKSMPEGGLDMGGGARILDNRQGQVKKGSSAPWVLKTGNSLFDISSGDIERMLGGETGESAYTRITAMLGGQNDATKYLREKGIPGIKYLDQGSRGAGNGTYNYVVFDDKIPKIMERNGVSLRELLGKK